MATLASVMLRAGRRVGSYTSPHLVSFRERIRVDGVPLSEDALKAYAAEVRDAISACGLTFFEAATLLAFHAFAREGVELAALEVGLGGRLDATNVVVPEVTAVTNVALDHADYLGETLLAIAREKAGIMKRGVPFVTTERDEDVIELFRDLSAEVGAPLHTVPTDAVWDLRVRGERTTFRMRTDAWGELDIVSPLVGRHQASNTALAVAVCERLPDRWRPSAEEVLGGVAGVEHRGRDEVRSIRGRTWLFDVAHNPAGVESLGDTLGRLDLPRPLVAVVGILADKDWRVMLPSLMAHAAHLVVTQPPTAPPARRWTLSEVEREASAEWGGDGGTTRGVSVRERTVWAVEDLAAALDRARSLAGDGTVVVTGSVHTVGAAMVLLGVSPLEE